MHGLPWKTFVHNWGDSPMIFRRDRVTHEDHLRILCCDTIYVDYFYMRKLEQIWYSPVNNNRE